jgi:hypothetical protein
LLAFNVQPSRCWAKLQWKVLDDQWWPWTMLLMIIALHIFNGEEFWYGQTRILIHSKQILFNMGKWGVKYGHMFTSWNLNLGFNIVKQGSILVHFKNNFKFAFIALTHCQANWIGIIRVNSRLAFSLGLWHATTYN